MPNLKEQLILANHKTLQLQAQLDATNKNYIELNNRYLSLREHTTKLVESLDKTLPHIIKILKGDIE